MAMGGDAATVAPAGGAVHMQLERRGVGDAGAVGDLGGADTSGAFAGDLCSGGGGTAGEEAYAGCGARLGFG